MTEDKTAARKLVEADIKETARWLLHETGVPTECVVAEHGILPADLPAGDGTGLFIPITIGTRDNLTKAEAHSSAALWRNVKQRYPKAEVYAHLVGYDQDPRELYEFPEVRRFMRWWARAAGLDERRAGPATRCFAPTRGLWRVR